MPEKKPKIIVIFFSNFRSIFLKLRPKKLKNAEKIIDKAIMIEIVEKLIFNIKLQPIIKPITNAINIGRNLKLPMPLWTCICKIFVLSTGKHKYIIAVVGGKKKAIIGTENIDIPIPTAPLIVPPKKTEEITIIRISISVYPISFNTLKTKNYIFYGLIIIELILFL